MSKVQKIGNLIRDALNDSTITKTKIFLKKDDGFWDQLWTCLDTIEDTETAIQSFKNLSADNFREASYNHMYGLLQALYLQQDAVSNLKEAILGKSIIWEKEHPSVYAVRTTRNESAGHPTKIGRTGNKRYCVIDRNSLSKEGFNYSIWSNSRVSEYNVKFTELIQKQEDALGQELSEVLNQIGTGELKHVEKFEGQILANLLPGGELYSLSLLRQLAYDELGWIGFLQYKEKYTEIKKGIESRYGPLKNTLTIPGTKHLLDELDRIYMRIDQLKRSDKDVEIDLGIYADALVDRLRELRTHLEEIDAEFAKKPKT